MKKIHILMCLTLLSAQLILPTRTLAQEDIHTDDNIGSASNPMLTQDDLKLNDVKNNSNLDTSTNIQNNSSKLSDELTNSSTETKNTDNTSIDSKSLENNDISISASYLDNSHMTNISPLKLNIPINKPSNIDISNSKISLSGFDSNQNSLTFLKQN